MSIGIYDYASVPPDLLARAEGAVGQLYGTIGMRTRWSEKYHDQNIVFDAPLTIRVDQPDLALIILDARMTSVWAPPKDALGCAPGTRVERGRIAYMFYDRLKRLAVTADRTVDLMSLVIAHEIGHLLLPYGSHSDSGVMRADWSVNDPQDLAVQHLAFTSSQIQQIHHRLGIDP